MLIVTLMDYGLREAVAVSTSHWAVLYALFVSEEETPS